MPGRLPRAQTFWQRELHPEVFQPVFGDPPGILEQVEAVGDLLSIRSADGCATHVIAVPIPADDLNAQVGRQPVGQSLSFPIRQDIDRLMPFQIDQRAIGLAAPEAEIIHPENAWWRVFGQVLHPDQSQQRIATGAFVQQGQQALTGFAVQRHAHGALHLRETRRPLDARVQPLRPGFRERETTAGSGVTPQPPDVQMHFHGAVTHRRVLGHP